MFCDIDTAARIERAEADTIAAGTARCDDSLVIPLAGGVASYAGPGSPMNKIAGLGFGGVPNESELDAIEREFAARDTPVHVEVASLADPALCELLTARGYLLVSFENVLGLALTDVPAPVIPDGITVRHSGTDDSPRGSMWWSTGSRYPMTKAWPPTNHFRGKRFPAQSPRCRQWRANSGTSHYARVPLPVARACASWMA